MKKNYVINFACALLAVILLAVGIGVFMTNVKAPKAAASLGNTDISSVEILDYYYGEFCIVDVYSYTGVSQDAIEELHCYALIKDKYGNDQAVSLTVTKDDAPFEEIRLYASSPNGAIGDVVVKCYAKARNLKTWSDTLLDYYNELTKEYADIVGITVSTPIDFGYYCDAAEPFAELQKAEHNGPRIASAICTAIGGMLLFAAFLIPGIESYATAKSEFTPLTNNEEEASDDE